MGALEEVAIVGCKDVVEAVAEDEDETNADEVEDAKSADLCAGRPLEDALGILGNFLLRGRCCSLVLRKLTVRAGPLGRGW